MSEHVLSNRARWDEDAPNWVEAGHQSWARSEPHWGIWQVPESQLHVLPDVDGLDVVELGCGTGYVSSWLARRGAEVVGLDNSRRQLATAVSFQREFGVEFPLIHANAEAVPLASSSFDLAISEYGACLWCDPYRWVPEAARVLRPGGRLIFLTNSVLLMLTMPDLEVELGGVAPVGVRPHRDQTPVREFADDVDGGGVRLRWYPKDDAYVVRFR